MEAARPRAGQGFERGRPRRRKPRRFFVTFPEAGCSWDNHHFNTMKSILSTATLAALVAFAFIPSPAIAASAFLAVSLLTIFVADYTRALKPLAPRATVVAFPRPARPAQTCELAA